MSIEIPKDIESYKNEDFVLKCLSLLNDAGKLDDYTVNCLTDGNWCLKKEFMQREKSVLKEIPMNTTEKEFKILRLDGTSQSRFYSHTIIINNKKFMITNYWYGPTTNHKDNRTPFLNWVKKQLL